MVNGECLVGVIGQVRGTACYEEEFWSWGGDEEGSKGMG